MWRRACCLLLTCAIPMVTATAADKREAVQRQFKAGVTTRVFHPEAQRNWRGAQKHELDVTVWYPAAESAIETPQHAGPNFDAGTAAERAAMAPAMEPWPIVLLSHGTGGTAMQLAWLGTALARAGFVAAAVNHPGNNGMEPYTAEGFALWWERATDLSEVLDGMLADEEFGPKIDPARVGAAGFSLGGYTVLELGGARTDMSVLTDMCQQQPTTAICHVPEMKDFGTPDQVLHAVKQTSGLSLARSGESYRDPRVRSVFAIAPAPGMTLTAESLHAMKLPVEIVAGSADPIAVPKDNADHVRAHIRGARESILPGVAHYTFLDTCTAAGKQNQPVLCGDPAGVDRNAVHAQVAAMAVEFFQRTLRAR